MESKRKVVNHDLDGLCRLVPPVVSHVVRCIGIVLSVSYNINYHLAITHSQPYLQYHMTLIVGAQCVLSC